MSSYYIVKILLIWSNDSKRICNFINIRVNIIQHFFKLNFNKHFLIIFSSNIDQNLNKTSIYVLGWPVLFTHSSVIYKGRSIYGSLKKSGIFFFILTHLYKLFFLLYSIRCSCNSCTAMPTAKESLCCQEVQQIDAKIGSIPQLSCIIHQPGFDQFAWTSLYSRQRTTSSDTSMDN